MSRDLTGKLVLVTGAAVRVGRAIARRFGEGGADVAIHYRTHEDEAETLAQELRAMGRRALLLHADLRDAAAVRGMFARLGQEWGGLDVLVNSASIFRRTPLDEATDEDWAQHLDVNLTAPWLCIRAALPLLRARGGGKVVNIVDDSAVRPWPSYIPHSVSKAGLLALTRGLARALAKEGIAVNAVAPGPVLFPEDYDADARERVLRRVPTGRSGTPADVASAVLYLCTASSFVTGALLNIDGGQALG